MDKELSSPASGKAAAGPGPEKLRGLTQHVQGRNQRYRSHVQDLPLDVIYVTAPPREYS